MLWHRVMGAAAACGAAAARVRAATLCCCSCALAVSPVSCAASHHTAAHRRHATARYHTQLNAERAELERIHSERLARLAAREEEVRGLDSCTCTSCWLWCCAARMCTSCWLRCSAACTRDCSCALQAPRTSGEAAEPTLCLLFWCRSASGCAGSSESWRLRHTTSDRCGSLSVK